MLMPGRTYTSSKLYRYGFNGKENDNEIKGEGNQQDYGMRIYDPRIGRFLSVDPLATSFPWYTPYQFAGNKPIFAVDLDGLEEKETITLTEVAEGKSALRIAWKSGNGKVVKMVAKQAMTKTVLVKIAKRGCLLSAIFEIFTSPNTSPQDVAKDYPSAIADIDKFWRIWIGPGRNFPLPPLNSADRPQWFADNWPEGLPLTLPNPVNLPNIDTKPVGDDNQDKDDGFITLYRGVGKEITPEILYDLAEQGTAYPKGLLPGHNPHNDPDDHTMGDNESIYTSWTLDKNTATIFARGTSGKSSGVILSKKFKKSQLTQSNLSGLMQEREYLIPGVVNGAHVEKVNK
jgi:RHS repeat-associated protein